MFTAPPVLCYFPGSGGFGPIAQPWWTHFCSQTDAQAMMLKVQALGDTNLKLIDATTQGGTYASFAAYFQYIDPTIRMWQVVGTMEVNGTQMVVSELLGDLIDGQTRPRPFVDSYNRGQTPVLKFNDTDPTDIEVFWGV